jgi:nucleoside-diphosphate-sugar epimerase
LLVSLIELALRKIKESHSANPPELNPLPKNDPKRRCPDTAKLERIVGWKPSVSFEEGLKRTVAWFSQGEQQSF